MDRTERFYKIDQLLRERLSTPLAVIMDHLEVSRATVKRDIEYMRDRMGAPIVWDRSSWGYRYEGEGSQYALPGMWFNASEIYALLTMDHLLSDLQPGLLGPHIQPLRRRVHELLEQGDHSAEEVARRIHIVRLARRDVDAQVFESLASALLSRQRVMLHHYNRASNEVVGREVSPQRLLYYRDNWYLHAWCHLRQGLRSFGVDVIRRVDVTGKKAKDVSATELDAVFASGYGIFAGEDTQKALLRFSAGRARWVAHERWHPQQQGRFDEQGRYLLQIPYSQDTELLLDILRYGADVEVLEPDTLRRRVKAALGMALQQYGGKG
ncbi:helix-turn-helix transcriptional regulator [Thiolapillus sp.]|uniref:helix-turn-helix transcriptional regulator n=8 Tax=Thiolapillus sp. TaxID=2017437 RepID=UPI0025F3F901|nr:WYL domain-containing protein [Thiolapillus sp.]